MGTVAPLFIFLTRSTIKETAHYYPRNHCSRNTHQSQHSATCYPLQTTIRSFSSWGFFSSEGTRRQCDRGEHATPEASPPRRHTQEWDLGTTHSFSTGITYLLLLEVGVQHDTRSVASDIEASLSKPHNFHHDDCWVVVKEISVFPLRSWNWRF